MTVIFYGLSSVSSSLSFSLPDVDCTIPDFHLSLVPFETFCTQPQVPATQLYRPLLMRVRSPACPAASSSACSAQLDGCVYPPSWAGDRWYVLLFVSDPVLDFSAGSENLIQCRTVLLSDQQRSNLLDSYLENTNYDWFSKHRIDPHIPRTKQLLKEAIVCLSGDLLLEPDVWNSVEFYEAPSRLCYFLFTGNDPRAHKFVSINLGSMLHPHSCKPCARFHSSIQGSCKYGNNCDFCHEAHQPPGHRGSRGRNRTTTRK